MGLRLLELQEHYTALSAYIEPALIVAIIPLVDGSVALQLRTGTVLFVRGLPERIHAAAQAMLEGPERGRDAHATQRIQSRRLMADG